MFTLVTQSLHLSQLKPVYFMEESSGVHMCVSPRIDTHLNTEDQDDAINSLSKICQEIENAKNSFYENYVEGRSAYMKTFTDQQQTIEKFFIESVKMLDVLKDKIIFPTDIFEQTKRFMFPTTLLEKDGESKAIKAEYGNLINSKFPKDYRERLAHISYWLHVSIILCGEKYSWDLAPEKIQESTNVFLNRILFQFSGVLRYTTQLSETIMEQCGTASLDTLVSLDEDVLINYLRSIYSSTNQLIELFKQNVGRYPME